MEDKTSVTVSTIVGKDGSVYISVTSLIKYLIKQKGNITDDKISIDDLIVNFSKLLND